MIEAGELNLSYVELGHAQRTRVIVFLHGIMGNKKNWLNFAKLWLASRPDWTAIIFDLRNHGESLKHQFPLTIEACAQDIVKALQSLADSYKCVLIGRIPYHVRFCA